MPLSIGTRLGAYEVLALLGTGGMGEVYRARDTRLKREVAIKVLPDAFSRDPDRHARFQREAELLATLNHSNIAQIYGFEEGALVLELVEGPTLAELSVTPMPLTDALHVARQIADALEAAHERGIIHRDLKPANIKLRADGTVKVLDFGLAKAIASDIDPDPSNSPTLTAVATRAGVIVGTAAYMSPEQARGKPLDKRTDIWAFGCVLYELVTAKRAFAGDTISDTIAAILEREPDWTALPVNAPAPFRQLLQRCLTKDPKRRLRDIGDAHTHLDERLAGGSVRDSAALSSAPARAGRRSAALVAVGTLAVGAVGGWVSRSSWQNADSASGPAGSRTSEVRLEITTPPTTDPVSLAISPDGTQVAFGATSEGRPLLWLRSLSEVTARPLAGTGDAAFPFWSPDGKAIGFFADRMLKRIDLSMGTVQSLAPAEGGRGGAWNEEGTIVFQPTGGTTPLRTVQATGGQSREIGVGLGRFPQFLPGGRLFIYSRTYGAASSETRGLYLGSLDGGEPRPLVEASDSAGVYAPSGHVLFVQQGTLVAQFLDLSTRTMTGAPFPVAGRMSVNGPLWLSPLSASAAGPIVYRTGSAGGMRQLAWFDRTGKEISRVGSLIPNSLSPALSPDGQRVVFHQSVNGNTDIWLLDAIRGATSRFTTGAGAEYHPLWSPDGRRVLFSQAQDLVAKPITGSESDETILKPDASPAATDWSSDGQFLLITMNEPYPSRDIFAVSLSGAREPFPVARTTFNERDGQFSPDGSWVAYTSDESGRDEVFAQRFPTPTDRVQISTAGGGMARWRRDGREMFYIGLDGRLMAVTLRATSGATSLGPSAPAPLFLTRIGPAVQANSKQQYMVSADGQRFLMNTLAEENAAPITVILNWKARP